MHNKLIISTTEHSQTTTGAIYFYQFGSKTVDSYACTVEYNDEIINIADGSSNPYFMTFELGKTYVFNNLVIGSPMSTGIGVYDYDLSGFEYISSTMQTVGYYRSLTVKCVAENPTIGSNYGYGPMDK